MSRKKTNKIEAETGEVVQSNKPFIIRNGGIAKPIGQGLYLLGGKTHEQGGIDIDFTGDARIFSAQPILNGNSPAELVTRGANPNQTFIRQERFKDINGINDDGSKRAKCGKRIKAENGTEIPGMKLAKRLNLLKSTEENPVYAEMENPLWQSTENLNRDFVTSAINLLDNGAKLFMDKEGKVNYSNGEVDIPVGATIVTKDNLKSIRKGLDYIGGDKTQSRLNYFKKVPALVNMVDSLSNVYGINKDVMLHRLSKEGLIDNKISEYNYYLDEKGQRNVNEDILKYVPSGFYELGLDRAGEHLAKGNYNMRWKDENLGYDNSTSFNEKGNAVGTVHVPNMASGLEIKAAHIEYLTNIMKKKYPNASKKELDALINAAYNLGENHKDLNDKEWINKNYEVLPWSEMINKSMNNSNKKQLGGSTGLIRVQANGKDRLMYVPFTGEETKASREKAKYGTRRATDGNRFMSYDRASYLLNLNKGNNINIIDDKVKEKINDLPSEKDIKPIERDIVEKENLEFTNGNKTEAAPKPVGKSYHNISASNSSAVARGIARKLNYNFSDHGSTDFRTADLNNAIFTNRPDTVPTITSIYGNDFVAPSGTLGSTRRAIDFRNENESIKIDNKIPVDRITRYYGNNKQGDFIIGDLSSFKDDDYVAAVRNKSMPFNDVVIKNGKLYYLKDGQIVESSLPEGENNKHIVYNSKTGKKQFVSTTKDVNKLYDFYKQFLTDNEGLADIVLLDNGRFEDNIYKGGRPLTDEEISDYYRNDFNRGFDKVPVLISGRMKRFGGKTTNRAKAEYGLGTSNYFNTRASILGYKPSVKYLKTNPMSFTKDEVVDVMSGTKTNLAFADPYNPNKSYSQLLSEGYFDNTGFTPYGRRIAYNNRNITNDENINTTSIDNNSNNKINFTPKLDSIAGLDNIKFETPITTDIVNKITVPESLTKHLNNTYITNKNNQTNNKFKDWYSKNSDTVNAGIGAIGNIGAGLTSYLINKNMLNDLDYVSTPVAKRAVKLKTNININPELTALNENLSRTIDATNANTASSRVANAINQAAMLDTTLAKNKLYANKENRETALINKDRLNQQEVANDNIDAYNTWRSDKNNFENTVREQLSENSVSLVDNINKGIQGGITDYEKRRQFKNSLAVMAAAYPNVTPELLRTYGVDFLRMGGKVKLNKTK